MAGIVAAFKGLKLDEMIEVYPQITAALNSAKEVRRQQLQAEIKSLGFRITATVHSNHVYQAAARRWCVEFSALSP